MEVNLWDLPEDKIYVKLNDTFHKKLFTSAIKHAGSQSALSEMLRTSNKKFNKDMKSVSQKEISRWFNNYNLIRLDIINFISKLMGYSVKDVQKNIEVLKGLKTSEPIFNPNLPFKLDSYMANLVAKLSCDGCILDRENSFTVQYSNTNLKLIEEFKRDVVDVFGNTKIKIVKRGSIYIARTTGLIGFIITKYFGSMHAVEVPSLIKNSNIYIKSAFIRGVFDDESTVHKGHGQIRLKMLNRRFVNGIKSILENDFKISCSDVLEDSSSKFSKNTHYYFLISNRFNLEKFRDRISFTHPKKAIRLNQRLSNVIKAEYPKGVSGSLIYDILKNSSMTSKEIAYILNRSNRIVQTHLNNLKEKGLVNYQPIKRRYSYEFLWKVVK